MFDILPAEALIDTNLNRIRYPFGELKIGESFVVSLEKSNSARASAQSYSRRHAGVKFKTRTVEGGSVRIYRTA